MSAAHQETTLQVVIGKVCQLLETKSMTYFRMLSIGCGDGLFDLKILQAITDRFPAIKIHYIGTDIDEQICRKATELLSSLKNVEVEVRVIDFQQVDSSKITEIPPCDLVLAAHVFYYMRDINKALSEAQMLRKSDGIRYCLAC